MFVRWIAVCVALLIGWIVLFAVLANPVLIIPAFALVCVYAGYIHEPLRRRLRTRV